jgi:hypothetical protein
MTGRKELSEAEKLELEAAGREQRLRDERRTSGKAKRQEWMSVREAQALPASLSDCEKHVRRQIKEARQLAAAERLSPESRQSLVRRLKKLAETLRAFAAELESEE